jgi:hypothetical protein
MFERIIDYNNDIIKIIDSDFEEKLTFTNYDDLYKSNYILSQCHSDVEAIVLCYKRRGLNVAANIAIFLNKYYMEDVGDFVFEEVFEKSEMLSPYIEKIKKYLLLI